VPDELPINLIHVGDHRAREDVGDLTRLLASIPDVGLLHPVVVSRDGTLIAGRRRLEACRQLGWQTVPITVADSVDTAARALRAERDENLCRRPLRLSEAVALARRLRPLEQAAARRRQAATQLAGKTKAGKPKVGGGNCPPPKGKGKARDAVAKAVGLSARTLAKAGAVVDAAESDPATYGDLAETMDATGQAAGPHRDLLARQGRGLPMPEVIELRHVKMAIMRRLGTDGLDAALIAAIREAAQGILDLLPKES